MPPLGLRAVDRERPRLELAATQDQLETVRHAMQRVPLDLAREAAGLVLQAAIHAAIVRLAPWSHHHHTCAKVIDLGLCTCGLQEALLEVDPS